MILLGRPSPERVEAYRAERIDASPTCRPATDPPAGFRQDSFERVVGAGRADFGRARAGLHRWAAHRGAGVEVVPAEAALEPGAVVALVTRQAGLWVLAACRVEDVVEDPTRFGFTYATLPDHPECGYESFTVSLHDGTVTFAIDAVSRPGTALVRLVGPAARVLQRRASAAYLSAMERWVGDGAGPAGRPPTER